MRLTVFNLKGGQGKTTISLALAMLYGFYVVTNDEYSPINEVLGEKKTYHLEAREELPDVPRSVDLIYDFGGKADHRVIEAIKQSDFVIIPIFYKSPLDMQTTISTIQEIEEYTKNILIVVNMAKGDMFAQASTVLKKFFSYDLLEVKESTAFSKMVTKKLSIKQLMDQSFLYKHHYQKPLEQIEAIKQYVTPH